MRWISGHFEGFAGCFGDEKESVYNAGFLTLREIVRMMMVDYGTIGFEMTARSCEIVSAIMAVGCQWYTAAWSAWCMSGRIVS